MTPFILLALLQDALELKTNDGAAAPQVRLSVTSGATTADLFVQRGRLRFDKTGSAGYFNLAGTDTTSPIAGDVSYSGGTLQFHNGSGWQTITTTGTAVQLQSATPGTQQTGHFNISGTGRAATLTLTSASNQLVLSSGVNQLTLNGGTSAAARTYAIPDVGASGTFMMLEGAQVVSGAKSMNAILSFGVSGHLTLPANTSTTTGRIWYTGGNVQFYDGATRTVVSTDATQTLTNKTWNGVTIGVTYGGTGTSTQFTSGSVVFAGGSGVYAQDNSNFFWDDTNNRLGIRTTSPAAPLHVSATGDAILIRPATMVLNDTARLVFADPDGGTTSMSLQFKDDASPDLTLQGGNFGIGITDPTARLHVVPPTVVGHISAGALATWGTGGSFPDDPFNTWYHDSRTQTVYLASELTAAGMSAGNINYIALRCYEVPGQQLTSFRIRMQATAATTSTAWVTSGWTTVYGPVNLGTGSFTAGAWIVFTLSTPFNWNGTSNLLIDISNDDAAFTSGGGCYVRTGLTSRTFAGYSDSGYTWPYDTMPGTTYNHILDLRFTNDTSATPPAAILAGDVTISGVLSKGSGTFLIDHPLDPANKILRHSFVESPEMMNVYKGRAKIADGRAVVELPEYFDALNAREGREVLLTCVNGFSPLWLEGEVRGNRFVVRGDRDGQEFGWVVLGVRADAHAKTHPVVVEQEKGAGNPFRKGEYIHPEAKR